MDRIEFGYICELAELMDTYITTNISENEYPIVSVYGNYEIVKTLIESLVMLGNPIGSILELEEFEMSHYNKEFVVYLTEDGVTCEKTWHKDCYYNGGGDISFIYEDCSSKLLSHIDSEVMYEFAIGECEDDEECDCDECQCACTDKEIAIEKDGDMHGFSVNQSGENGWSSYSFYSTDMDLVKTMAKLFE